MTLRELPTFYYHTHFFEFLAFVKGPSAHLLSKKDKKFLASYAGSSYLKQCLLVRLINRKHAIIKKHSLKFDEIPDAINMLDDLAELGFVKPIALQDVPTFLNQLTKPELAELYHNLTDSNSPRLLKSTNKANYILQCQIICPQKIVQSHLAQNYVVRITDEFIEYFLFLYFGHTNGKLNQFSMRDLGLVRTREAQAQMQSRFKNYESAFSCFTLKKAYSEAKRMNFDNAESINDFLAELPNPIGVQAIEVFEKLHYIVAKQMLVLDHQKALDITNNLQDSSAQEFWCRQAYKFGLKEHVKAKLNEIINDPINDKLLQFAEDFLALKYQQKRTSILTDMLRENNRHLLLDETFKGSVEQGVIAYYHARYIKAWRTENYLWNNLFGLCFWHELFQLEGLGLATPFDYLPVCLKHYQFLQIAEQQIHKRLNNINTSQDLLMLLTKNAAAHFGKSQGIVHWHVKMLDSLKILIEYAPLQGLKNQLLTMCKNWHLYNDGYPDIMVLENNKLRFEEVKANGDSLRRNQLMQYQSLRSFNIEVGITTVDWTIDPMQPYAVIDIETTGGRSGVHKITEIGMVKIVNGKVVEQWESLLNPQRKIPTTITNLTGISNEMVANAPLFADIADEVEKFTQDCIFVAHNVNFDYGFIREEFARLNRTYRRPKLCTVQQTRKYFKGLKSYSLANLTKHFDITMECHHRALSDAIAASELLTMVNEVRYSQTTPMAKEHLNRPT